MIKVNDFNLRTIQVSLFVVESLFNSNKVFGHFMSHFGEVFNGDPVSLPLPPDAPGEIPRITLTSKDAKYKLEIASTRINIYRNLVNSEDQINISDFFELAYEIVSEYMSCTCPVIGRIALVTSRVTQKDNAAFMIAKQFCKEKYMTEPFNRPATFELHSHKDYSCEGFNINSWVRCKSGKIINPENAEIVLVEQDINTLAEEINEKKYDLDQIKKFYNSMVVEQSKILEKYFNE